MTGQRAVNESETQASRETGSPRSRLYHEGGKELPCGKKRKKRDDEFNYLQTAWSGFCHELAGSSLAFFVVRDEVIQEKASILLSLPTEPEAKMTNSADRNRTHPPLYTSESHLVLRGQDVNWVSEPGNTGVDGLLGGKFDRRDKRWLVTE